MCSRNERYCGDKLRIKIDFSHRKTPQRETTKMPKNPFNWKKDDRGSSKYTHVKYKKLKDESPSPPRCPPQNSSTKEQNSPMKEQNPQPLPPKTKKIVEEKNLITFD